MEKSLPEEPVHPSSKEKPVPEPWADFKSFDSQPKVLRGKVVNVTHEWQLTDAQLEALNGTATTIGDLLAQNRASIIALKSIRKASALPKASGLAMQSVANLLNTFTQNVKPEAAAKCVEELDALGDAFALLEDWLERARRRT
jgi:ubiquinone biosynthesis protein UbiJ